MMIANGLLLLTILRSRSLRVRKEMVIIGGVATVDTMYGLSAIMLAVYRIVLIYQGMQSQLVSPWECVTRTPYFFITICVQLTSVVNVAVSCDRLIAVAWPTKYHKLDLQYAGKVLVSAYFLQNV